MNIIEEIKTMNREALEMLWHKHFRREPPFKISQPMMQRILAYEAQVRLYGGLDRKTKNAIRKCQLQNSSNKSTSRHSGTVRLKSGSRLMREWHGKTHFVDVTDEGYQWQDKTYRSLSAIARAITGAQWSGPRFFGLTREISQ